MPNTKRILPDSPHIASNEELTKEYKLLNNLSLPKEVYLARGGPCAQTPQKSAGHYVPDSEEDRVLLKTFETLEGRVVEFGIFRKRVKKGWTINKAAYTPIRQTKSNGLKKLYETYVNPTVQLHIFISRILKLHWTAERAINTPERTIVARSPLTAFYLRNIERAAVDRMTFICRVNNRDWSEEKALTEPLVEARQRKSAERLYYESSPTTPAVSFSTFYQRVKKLKWPMEKALSTPSAF